MGSRVFAAPPTSWDKVELEARRLLREVAPQCLEEPLPTPVLSIFEGGLTSARGMGYGVEEIDDEAYFDPISNEVILSENTYLTLGAGEGRARFTVCHEFGHAALHKDYLSDIFRKRRQPILLKRTQVPPYQDLECQANVFASEVLMPTPHVRKMILQGWTSRDVRVFFEVSAQAADVKYGRVVARLRKEGLA